MRKGGRHALKGIGKKKRKADAGARKKKKRKRSGCNRKEERRIRINAGVRRGERR